MVVGKLTIHKKGGWKKYESYYYYLCLKLWGIIEGSSKQQKKILMSLDKNSIDQEISMLGVEAVMF